MTGSAPMWARRGFAGKRTERPGLAYLKKRLTFAYKAPLARIVGSTDVQLAHLVLERCAF